MGRYKRYLHAVQPIPRRTAYCHGIRQRLYRKIRPMGNVSQEIEVRVSLFFFMWGNVFNYFQCNATYCVLIIKLFII